MKKSNAFVLCSLGCLVICGAEQANAQAAPGQPIAPNQANSAQVGSPATAPPGAVQPAVQPGYPQAVPAAPVPVAPAPAPRTATVMPGQGYILVDPATGAQVTYAPIIRQRPQSLPYLEGAPVPRGYMLEEYHPRGLIISGAVTLGVLYAISLSVASSNNFNSTDGWLAVPVIGPFGWLAAKKDQQCVTTSYSSYCDDTNNSGDRTAVMFDGLGQVAGAALLTAGLAITRKRLTLVDQDIVVAPYSTGKASGLTLVGRF